MSAPERSTKGVAKKKKKKEKIKEIKKWKINAGSGRDSNFVGFKSIHDVHSLEIKSNDGIDGAGPGAADCLVFEKETYT